MAANMRSQPPRSYQTLVLWNECTVVAKNGCAMKHAKSPDDLPKLTVAVQGARRALAKASTEVDTASQFSSVVKRQRKDARTAARRAKKLLKHAEDKLAEAKDALASAEKKLARAGKYAIKAGKPVARPKKTNH